MAKSAKNGTVDWGGAVADVTDIKISESSDVKEYASSSTAGAKGRIAGHSDTTGSFTVLTDDTSLFEEGDSGTLVITSDGAVEMFNGNAIILSVEYGVPVSDGGPCEVNVSWGADPIPVP